MGMDGVLGCSAGDSCLYGYARKPVGRYLSDLYAMARFPRFFAASGRIVLAGFERGGPRALGWLVRTPYSVVWGLYCDGSFWFLTRCSFPTALG